MIPSSSCSPRAHCECLLSVQLALRSVTLSVTLRHADNTVCQGKGPNVEVLGGPLAPLSGDTVTMMTKTPAASQP